jgi:hypothetical protein
MPALFPTILRAMAAQAVEKRCEEITFSPAAGPPLRGVRTALRHLVADHLPSHSDGMMRIMNQQPLFEKLLPVLNGGWRRRPA